MGVPWITQVRRLHLTLLFLAIISFFLYVVYMSMPSIVVAPTPALYMLKFNITPIIVPTIIRNETLQSSLAPIIKTMTNLSLAKETLEITLQPNDLSRGVAAEIIYEPGHADVTSDICPQFGHNLELLIAITSAPNHQSARMAIRQTWGHFGARRDVSITFMLGTTSNQTIIEQIKQEEYLYGDIIIGKFIDTYDNLTLKTISMLEWVDNYCPKASFVLKTDDDMFINVSRLLAFISKHKPEHRNIYGRLAKKWKPIRQKKSKYYISPQQYKPAIFPDFTTGPAYLFPARLARELYVAALNHTYFKLEDVFVTGIVANGLKIKRVHAPEFLNKRVPLTPCSVQRGISIHMVKGAEQYDLWKKLLDGLAKCK